MIIPTMCNIGLIGMRIMYRMSHAYIGSLGHVYIDLGHDYIDLSLNHEYIDLSLDHEYIGLIGWMCLYIGGPCIYWSMMLA